MRAEHLGVDGWEVIRLANRHPRVNILQPGPGVGGHRIAVDPWFLVHGAPDPSRLLRTARAAHPPTTPPVLGGADMPLSHSPEPPVARLGLAFKHHTTASPSSPAVRFPPAHTPRIGQQPHS